MDLPHKRRHVNKKLDIKWYNLCNSLSTKISRLICSQRMRHLSSHLSVVPSSTGVPPLACACLLVVMLYSAACASSMTSHSLEVYKALHVWLVHICAHCTSMKRSLEKSIAFLCPAANRKDIKMIIIIKTKYHFPRLKKHRYIIPMKTLMKSYQKALNTF